MVPSSAMQGTVQEIFENTTLKLDKQMNFLIEKI